MSETWGADGRSRRRLGLALVAYGAVGVIVLGVLLAGAVIAGIQVNEWSSRIASARGQVVTLLGDTERAITAAAETTGGASTSLGDAAQSIVVASELASLVADSADGLAGLTDFSILGQQPFSGARPGIERLTSESRRLGTSLSEAGTSLAGSSDQVLLLGDRLDAIAADMGVITTRLAAMDLEPGPGVFLAVLVGIALITWLMVQAVAALIVGIRLRRV